MKPCLVPVDPLSQVVFVHHYLQLVFQSESFSIYNRATLDVGGQTIQQGAPGFADALVRLIGLRVESCEGEPGLRIRFESGAEVEVLMGDADISGPEAFQYNGARGEIVVAQNAV